MPGAHYRAGVGDDLYALGVVFYRLLTGRDPFLLGERGGVDVEAVLHEAPLPPHLVNPRVPRAVEEVCLRLLEKTPEARHPGAVALCAALEKLRARADESWKVPLLGRARAAGKGNRWARVRRAAAWAGVGLGLGLVLGGAWLAGQWRARREMATVSSPVTLPAESPMREASVGQEVAASESPPESSRAATPPPVEYPPAAAAPPAASGKDTAPVKKQQKQRTKDPQRETQSRSEGAVARNVCLGLTGVALQACLSAQQQVPPVRPMPPPQECPAGAVETMTRTLGLDIGEVTSGDWSDVRGRPVPVHEDTPFRVAGLWGDKLPHKTLLYGRLYFGEKRVYGRFTEARTPTGETYKVCLRLNYRNVPGTLIQPGSTPENMLVGPVAEVEVVDHFDQADGVPVDSEPPCTTGREVW
ncbi:hypothetical protein JRI60_11770 [Archangium violaceum]|uniref:hypothetical protein n=1 Tax=Archangium violaceum TaxID=83451 RepID=UPI0019514EA9|nr:hypothetical protein [Archangium violaceum]QRN99650.1 hypothetical protein JRI60_11770 [Archangium violaceum]